ncbi:MAG TPA: hypothetical protein VMW10_04860 [Alphaproteobacteria bacterium]|nr:hypothetical protein [Alphaproteobacteria bacterium]
MGEHDFRETDRILPEILAAILLVLMIVWFFSECTERESSESVQVNIGGSLLIGEK